MEYRRRETAARRRGPVAHRVACGRRPRCYRRASGVGGARRYSASGDTAERRVRPGRAHSQFPGLRALLPRFHVRITYRYRLPAWPLRDFEIPDLAAPLRLFENPKAQVTWEDGSTATTHDKGFSSCVVSIGDTQIEVTTLHLIPFRTFRIELESRTAQDILQDVAGKLMPARDKALIQGDFNIDRPEVQPYLRQLFARAGLAEVALDEPTTPGG